MQTMRRNSARLALAASLIWIPLAMGASAYAQTSELAPEQSTNVQAPVIPQQVRYAGKLATRTGDTVEAVFSIYAAAEGGEPLWTETQKVTVDQDGSYTVLLGSVSHSGLPQTLFQGGAARWLGVSVERAPELSRVLLSSVPYAMKSADTQALAGHPAGDFVTQEQLSQFAQSEAQRVASPEFNPLTGGTITGSGTTGTIPQFTGTNTIGNSEIVQVGSDIGVNEATPAATLDVGGTGQFRGTLMLPSLGTATTSAGARSQELQLSSSVWSTTVAGPISPIYKMYSGAAANNTANAAGTLLFTYQVGSAGTPSTILSLNSNGSFVTYGGVTAKTPSVATSSTAFSSPLLGLGASVYKSSTSAAVAQNWGWQAIPTGNNTSTPSSNIALVYSTGSATPAATGLSIGTNGIVNFAAGQTFPGGGGGTITGISTSSPLTGSGTAGPVALGLNESTLVTDITPSMATALEPTYNNVYAQLDATDTFTNQTFFNSGMVGSTSAGPNFSATQGLGTNGSIGVYGSSDTGYGVEGISNSGTGVYAISTSGIGLYATGGANGPQGMDGAVAYGGSTSISGVQYGGAAFSGVGGAGVGSFGNQGGGDGIDATGGTSTASSSVAGNGGYLVGGGAGPGVYGGNGVYTFGGRGEQGGYGISAFGGDAVSGCGDLCTAGAGGVFNGGGGSATNGGDGILAYAGDQGGTGIVGVSCSGYSDSPNCTYAGLFLGDVDVVGNVSKSGGSFKIDHPLDPANKYLYHSFVESPDMKNIYDGTIVTDGGGLATVTLPDWFSALNSDFRYQLTVIGQFAQAIVASEINNNSFTIQTNKPNVKVSWQVTGIRQDAWANAHRIPVEVDKAKGDQGHYLHPELFGHTGEPSIAALHHPRPKRRVIQLASSPRHR